MYVYIHIYIYIVVYWCRPSAMSSASNSRSKSRWVEQFGDFALSRAIHPSNVIISPGPIPNFQILTM